MGLIKMRDWAPETWAVIIQTPSGVRELFAFVPIIKTPDDVVRLGKALGEICKIPGVLETLDRCGFHVRIEGRQT